MVRVPIWEPSVSNLPGASHIRTDPDSFGASIGAAQEKAGRWIEHGLAQLGGTLTEMQNEQDAISAKTATSDYEAAHNQEEIRLKSTVDPSQAYTIPTQMQEWRKQNWPTYQNRITNSRYRNIANGNVTVFHNSKNTEDLLYVEKTKDQYIPLQIQSAAAKQYGAGRDGGPAAMPQAADAITSMIDEPTSLNEMEKRKLKLQTSQELHANIFQGLLKRANEGDSAAAAALKDWNDNGLSQIRQRMGVKELPPFGSPVQPNKRSEAIDKTPIGQIADAAAAQNGVDPVRLKTVISVESGGSNKSTGSYHGPGQLSAAEFAKYGSGNIFNPKDNVFATARKMANEDAKFAAANGRPPTLLESYMQHQQGEGGTAMHLQNPDRPAWQNMYATAEGRRKGEAWSKKAIWGNVPDDQKRKFGSVENLTSRDFMAMWDTKLTGSAGAGTSLVASTGVPKGPIPGAVAAGNVPLTNYPPSKSGGVVTKPITFTENNKVVLVPTVTPDGGQLSQPAALAQYRDTGQHLGVFDNEKDANDYAKTLHEANAAALETDRQAQLAGTYGTSLLSPEGVPIVDGASKQDRALLDHQAVQIRAFEAAQQRQVNQIRVVATKHLEQESPAMKWGGEAGQNQVLTSNVLRQLFGATSDIHLDRRAADLKFHAGPGSWTAQTTPEQMADDLTKMNPQNIDPQSPAFKHWVDNYNEGMIHMSKILDAKDKVMRLRGETGLKEVYETARTDHEVSDALIDKHKDFWTEGQLKEARQLQANPPAIKSPAVIAGIENSISAMPPEDFFAFMQPFVRNGEINRDLMNHYLERNATFWAKGVTTPEQDALGLIERKLGGILGGPKAEFRQGVLADAYASYKSWARENPGMAKDYMTTQMKAFEIINRSKMEGMDGLEIGVARSPYFPEVPTDQYTADHVKWAKESYFSAVDRSAIGPQQAANEWRLIKEWEGIIEARTPLEPGAVRVKTPRERPPEAGPAATAPEPPAPPAPPAPEPSFLQKLMPSFR